MDKQTEIKQQLDTLAEYQSQRDAAMLEKQRLIDAIYTAEIRAAIAEIEAEFSAKTAGVNENIAELEATIKAAVAEVGESVKGTIFHAVFAKGRTTWDSKAIEGYAAGHPDVYQFRKIGEPSVSIRSAK